MSLLPRRNTVPSTLCSRLFFVVQTSDHGAVYYLTVSVVQGSDSGSGHGLEESLRVSKGGEQGVSQFVFLSFKFNQIDFKVT